MQWLMQDLPKSSTELGMRIDLKAHRRKHLLPININRESDSHSKCLIEDCVKHDFPRISTLRGRQIDLTEDPRKQNDSIRFNPDSFENVIPSIPLQP
jgi:hypothetical protein